MLNKSQLAVKNYYILRSPHTVPTNMQKNLHDINVRVQIFLNL